MNSLSLMGLLKSILGVPENSKISKEFNKVFSPQVSDKYKESYEIAENDRLRKLEEKRNFPSTQYYNCPNSKCKSNPDITCTICNGTGHVD